MELLSLDCQCQYDPGMGLRETKIERARAQVLTVAQELFLEQGYAGTTMEQIAEQAEIGASTLYRYFPSKELLLLEPIVRSLALGPHLAARPPDEPLPDALGAVLRGAFPPGELDPDRYLALRKMVDAEPGPRARLWDLVDQVTAELEHEIALRLGTSARDERVFLAARIAFLVYDLAGRRWSGRTRRSWEQAVDRCLASLAGHDPVLPR